MNQNANNFSHCDHCAGTLRWIVQEDERAKRPAYVCNACGCTWDSGMALVRMGQRCPVHGREALRSAVLRIVQWLLEQGDAQPASKPL